MTDILGPDGLPIHSNPLLDQRPREQASEATARIIDHLYPGHGFMRCQKEDGSWYVVHVERPSATPGASKICGGLISTEAQSPDGVSDRQMVCSKCGVIRMNLKKPASSVEEMPAERGRHIYVPGE